MLNKKSLITLMIILFHGNISYRAIKYCLG